MSKVIIKTNYNDEAFTYTVKKKKVKKFIKKVNKFLVNRSENSIISFKHNDGHAIFTSDTILNIQIGEE
jgi:hypothetical protein